MKFVAIDVETANEDMSSICQIGLAVFSGGRVVDEWSTLINPKDWFSPLNIAVHGIQKQDVAKSLTFPKVFDTLAGHMEGQVCVCHTHFDRTSIHLACEKHGIPDINSVWLDSAKVVRRAWPEFAQRGYGLRNVCDFLQYEFNHHDALEDAKAAGHILLAASKHTGLDIDAWLKRVTQPLDPAKSKNWSGKTYTQEGNPEGHLYGEVIVFTGALTLLRREAAALAAGVGIKVDDNVTAKTTILAVGDQDIQKLAGHEKSRKHRKAEQLIEQGASIRIVRETDFRKLVSLK